VLNTRCGTVLVIRDLTLAVRSSLNYYQSGIKNGDLTSMWDHRHHCATANRIGTASSL